MKCDIFTPLQFYIAHTQLYNGASSIRTAAFHSTTIKYLKVKNIENKSKRSTKGLPRRDYINPIRRAISGIF